jgi:TM2 domain-containing membrane protein YozV
LPFFDGKWSIMKKSMKAALLSGLVFPGVGQVYLGQRRRGWAFIVSVILLFVTVVIRITMHAYREIAAAAANGVAIDITAIQKAVAAGSDTVTTAGLALLVLIWLAAIIDACMAGERLENTGVGPGG